MLAFGSRPMPGTRIVHAASRSDDAKNSGSSGANRRFAALIRATDNKTGEGREEISKSAKILKLVACNLSQFICKISVCSIFKVA